MYRRSELAKELFRTDNELDRFDLLTGYAFSAAKFPEEKKTDENRLLSCETKTWYLLGYDNGLRLVAESDSLFVKGLCAVLADIATKITAEDAGRDIGFADECYKQGIIDGERRKGLLSLEVKIKKFAKEIYGE